MQPSTLNCSQAKMLNVHCSNLRSQNLMHWELGADAHCVIIIGELPAPINWIGNSYGTLTWFNSSATFTVCVSSNIEWDAKSIFSLFEAGGYFYLHTIHSSVCHWFSLLFRVFGVCLSTGLCTLNPLKSPLNVLNEIKSFDFSWPFDLVNSQKSYKLIGMKKRNETKQKN